MTPSNRLEDNYNDKNSGTYASNPSIKSLSNFHGKVVSCFANLPDGGKTLEVAKRVMIIVVSPFAYLTLGLLALTEVAINPVFKNRNFTRVHIEGHVEGKETVSNPNEEHVEGKKTVSNPNEEHVEGKKTVLNPNEEHVEGEETVSNPNEEHVEGEETVLNPTQEKFSKEIATNFPCIRIKYKEFIDVWKQGDLLIKTESFDSVVKNSNNSTKDLFGLYHFFPHLLEDLENPNARALNRRQNFAKVLEKSDQIVVKSQEDIPESFEKKDSDYYRNKTDIKKYSEKTSCTLMPPDGKIRLFREIPRKLNCPTRDPIITLCMDLKKCIIKSRDVFESDARTSTKSSPQFKGGKYGSVEEKSYVNGPYYDKIEAKIKGVNLDSVTLDDLKSQLAQPTNDIRHYNEILSSINRETVMGISITLSEHPDTQSESRKDFEKLCGIARIVYLKQKLNIEVPLLIRLQEGEMEVLDVNSMIQLIDKYISNPEPLYADQSSQEAHPDAVIKQLKEMKTICCQFEVDVKTIP